MKIYKQEPKKFIRIMISRKGDDTTCYLTLIDCTANQVEDFLKKLIHAQGLSPFQTGNVTSIGIREAVGAKNGTSKSLSFRGLSPKATYDLIVKSIEPEPDLKQDKHKQ